MNWTVPIFIAVLFASAVLYTLYIGSEFIVYFGNAVQLGSLILAVINLNMARQLYRPGDQPQKAWTWLVAGTILWTLAQILSSYREVVLQELPYGDFSDVLWILGYVPFLMGLIILIRSFLNTGLPTGTKQSYILIALISTACFVTVLFSIIWPELKDSAKPFAAKLLDIAYPTLDILLLTLSAVLLRISWSMRGGSLAKAWLMLCIGFSMSAVADLILIHISDLSTTYRYLDILYFSSYFCIAIAGSIQVRMLRST